MTELSPEAKRLMQLARDAYSPDDQRVASVRSGLDARITPRGAGDGGGGGVGPAAAGALNLPRLIGVAVLAVGIGGATLIGMRGATKTTASGIAAPAAQAPAAPAIAAPAPAMRDESSAQPVVAREDARDRAPVPATAANERNNTAATQIEAARVAPATPRASPTPAPRVARARHAPAAPRARSIARVDRSSTSAPLSFAQEAAEREAPAQAASAVEHDPAPAAPEPNKVVDDSLAREIALLKRARAALDHNDPRAALAITDEHAAQFTSGVMRQERLATRVLALCALHRRADAVDTKHELERIAPRSPHLMRLRTSCAADDEAQEVK